MNYGQLAPTTECTLEHEHLFALRAASLAPCDGCNQDRSICGGPPEKEVKNG